MPIEHAIDPARGLLRLRARGVVAAEEAVEALERLASSEGFERVARVHVDLSELEPDGVSAAGVRRIAARASRIDTGAEGVRVAVLAPAPAVYGMVRMYAVLREDPPYELRVFREGETARGWLRLDEEG